MQENKCICGKILQNNNLFTNFDGMKENGNYQNSFNPPEKCYGEPYHK